MKSQWKEMPFGDFATLQRGADLPIQDRKLGKYPIVASNGVVGFHEAFVSQGPGVVTGRSRTIGKPTYIAGPFWPLNTVLWVSDFHENNPRFAYFFFKFFDFSQYSTGATVPTLNRNFVHPILIKVPQKPEQVKIAAVLWTVQHAIEVEEKLIETARDLKQSAMQKLFVYGLRNESQKATPYGEVPKSWEIKNLSEWAFVQSGATKGRLISPEDAIEVPYLRVANVQDGHLDLAEMKSIRIRRNELEGYRLQKDDVVLTEGGDFDKLGRGFIWEGQIDPCVHHNHIFAVRVNREYLWPLYFTYLAQSPYGKAYFLTVAHKTTNLACINTTKLRAFPVLRPELDEQKEIATILQTIDRKILLHERRRAVLSDLFKILLNQLMTAQIRVDKLDIDTSEVTKSLELTN